MHEEHTHSTCVHIRQQQWRLAESPVAKTTTHTHTTYLHTYVRMYMYSVNTLVFSVHLPPFLLPPSLLVPVVCPVGKPLSAWPQAEGAGPATPGTVSPPPTALTQLASNGYSEQHNTAAGAGGHTHLRIC